MSGPTEYAVTVTVTTIVKAPSVTTAASKAAQVLSEAGFAVTGSAQVTPSTGSTADHYA